MTMDDDLFELEPIIEAVMNEHKRKKRLYHELEYTEPVPCMEPDHTKPKMSLTRRPAVRGLPNHNEANHMEFSGYRG